MTRSKNTDNLQLKEMAVKAAARYSNNLPLAILEFVRIAHIESDPPLLENPNSAEKTMRELLPPYRFPATDRLSEFHNFYGCFVPEIHMTGYGIPNFLSKLKMLNVPENLIQEITEYVTDAERKKIKLNGCLHEKTILEEKMSEADKILLSKKGDLNKKHKAALNALGFQTSRKKPPEKKQNPQEIFVSYVDLVRKQGKSKEEAAMIIQKKYSIKRLRRVVRILHDYKRDVILKKAKNISPEFKKNINKKIEGLILDGRQAEILED